MPASKAVAAGFQIAEAGDADVVVVHAQVAAIGRDAGRQPGLVHRDAAFHDVVAYGQAGDDVGVAVDAGQEVSGQQHLDHVEVIDGDVGAGVADGKSWCRASGWWRAA